ncbi:MAG: type II secretion system protein GspG [Opitutae bacterium]|nr:type II secretion system protein GspG [Opitutae bacterium]
MFFQPHASLVRLAVRRACTADAPSRRSLGEGAFTLIELLAVLAIVAILTSIVLGSGRSASEASKAARAKAELAALSAALESYKLQHGDYPHTNANARLVQSLLGQLGPTGAPLASAGRAHLETIRFTFAPADPFASATATIVDPWGQPYRYAYRSTTAWANPSFVLYSIGPDGADSPALLAGGFADTTATANADNLYANRN